MRESRTYGSGRGACHEMHVPTATNTAQVCPLSEEDFMYREVAQWRHVRRCIQEEETPKRQVARDTGISRRTINKMLMHENPPGYGPRPPRLPEIRTIHLRN